MSIAASDPIIKDDTILPNGLGLRCVFIVNMPPETGTMYDNSSTMRAMQRRLLDNIFKSGKIVENTSVIFTGGFR